MFRRPVKSKKNGSSSRLRRRREETDNDDDEVETTIVNKFERKSKKKRTVVKQVRTSFQDNGTEDMVDTTNLTEAKNRQVQPSASSLYSKDELVRLKSEQLHYKVETGVMAVNDRPLTEAASHEEEFISLSGLGTRKIADSVVFTGDDAVRFGENDPKGIAFQRDDMYDRLRRSELDETSAVPQSQGSGVASPASHVSHKSLPLRVLHTQIVEAIVRIQIEKKATESSTVVRREQNQTIENDLKRAKSDLELSGKSFEYFQALRNKMALWVGAMRDLQGKILPVQEALHVLLADMAAIEQWQRFEEDIMDCLRMNDLLLHVIGRQPPTVDAAALQSSVDEFGRNVPSQVSLQRDKRRRKYDRIACERGKAPHGSESDALTSESESTTLRERQVALHRALEVALGEVDEEFTSLKGLVDEFSNWKQSFPVEYKQCFASLSLADLASVLVIAQLCMTFRPLSRSEESEKRWTFVILRAQESGLLDELGTERLMEKAVLPMIQNITAKWGCNLCSTRAVTAVAELIQQGEPFLPRNTPCGKEIRALLGKYVATQLDEICVLIPKHSSTQPHIGQQQNAPRSQLNVAVLYSSVGQVERMKKLMCNVLKHWGPFLKHEIQFSECILDFIGTKFLFLLSALKASGDSIIEKTSVEAFRQVWSLIRPTGWLADPALLVSSAAVRAAAHAFGLE